MWHVVLLLWSIPIALGVVLLARIIRNTPVVTDSERELLFGSRRNAQLSVAFGLKFAVLSVLLFFVGVAEGLLLINIGSVWMMLVPLATTVAVMLILAWWVRSASRDTNLQRETAQSRGSRTAALVRSWVWGSDPELAVKKAKEENNDQGWFSGKF
jgi:hypothetical protein